MLIGVVEVNAGYVLGESASRVAIVHTALVSSLTYLIGGQVDLLAALCVAPGAMVGAVIGSKLLRRIPVAQLRWMFVTFLLVIAARLVLVAPQRGGHVELAVPVIIGYVGLGLIMGMASGLFGISGSIIAVPLMISLFSASDPVGKGTSLLVSFPTSAVGTVANRGAGLVDVRAGLVVGIAAATASIPARRSPYRRGYPGSCLLACLCWWPFTSASRPTAQATR